SARIHEKADTDTGSILGAIPVGSHVELTVADNGPGIGAENREKLFRELFYSTKPRHRGLGLLVVYGILQRFGGGMHVADGKPSGTQVHLYFPIATPPRPVSERPTQHMLVVQADSLLRESLQRVLESSGYRVTATDSALTALGACAE